MSISISVGHGNSLHANMIIRDGSQGLIYASSFGYSTDSKNFATSVDKKDTIYCNGRYYETNHGRYTVESTKVPDSDFTHTVITRKDNRFEADGVDTLMLFCFFETEGEQRYNLETALQNDEPFPESLKEAVYDKLDRYYPWPALKPWIPYIITQLADGYYIHSAITQTMDDEPVNGKWLNCLVINTTARTILAGKTFKLAAWPQPANASNRSVTWTSNNPAIATVNSSGLVTGVKDGYAVITVKTVDGGYTKTCAITVGIPVTSVVINTKAKTMNVGKTFQLAAWPQPVNASNRAVTWTSSNTSVATVSATGLVTAKKKGTATITVKTVDAGYTETCTITVQ